MMSRTHSRTYAPMQLKKCVAERDGPIARSGWDHHLPRNAMWWSHPEPGGQSPITALIWSLPAMAPAQRRTSPIRAGRKWPQAVEL